MIRPLDLDMLSWLARIGGAAEADVARALSIRSARAARRRLLALEAAGLVRRAQLLHARPALWLATAAGLRLAGYRGLGLCSVSASGFAHLLACGSVAAELQSGISPATTLCGERELRAFERAAQRPLASAEVGQTADGSIALHRPDLVLWSGAGKAVAVEVELTCKAPRRLRCIARGWARSRCVDHVVYLCKEQAGRAVARAVEAESAQARIDVLALTDWRAEQVEARFDPVEGRSNSFVPSRA